MTNLECTIIQTLWEKPLIRFRKRLSHIRILHTNTSLGGICKLLFFLITSSTGLRQQRLLFNSILRLNHIKTICHQQLESYIDLLWTHLGRMIAIFTTLWTTGMKTSEKLKQKTNLEKFKDNLNQSKLVNQSLLEEESHTRSNGTKRMQTILQCREKPK